MAKSKKKDNKKRKYSGPKKIFSIRSLEEIVKSFELKKGANETVSEFEEKLYLAAKQTLDFVDSSSKHGIKLDLGVDSEYHFAGALSTRGLDMQGEGSDEEQIIKELTEIAGSYLLFEQINMLWKHGAIGDVHYDPEVSDHVVIKAHAVMKTKNVLFDTYDAVTRVSDKTFIFKDVIPAKAGVDEPGSDNPVRGLAVGLGPYSMIVDNELLYRL